MGGIVTNTPGDFGLPGLGPKITMQTRKVLLNDKHVEYEGTVVIDADTVDAGSTPTDLLRPGMLLVRVETGPNAGKYVQFGHTDAPGSAGAVKKTVVLGNFVRMTGNDGNTADRQGIGIIHGRVDEGQIIYSTSDGATKTALRAGCPLVEFVLPLA